MRRIISQTRKELIQIVRDWRTLALAVVLPLVLLVLLSEGFNLRVDDLAIIIQDFDDSPTSHDFIDAFRASVTIHAISWPVDKHPEDALRSNLARAALIIPFHFGRDMARGVNSPVQLLVDASDSNTAKLVAGYANQITRAYNQRTSPASPQPVEAAVRLWYNPGLSSKKFYGPGIFVLGISMFPPLLASLATGRLSSCVPALRPHLSHTEHSRCPALDLKLYLGTLLHRDRSGRAATGRGMAGRGVQSRDYCCHRMRFLRAGLAGHASDAAQGLARWVPVAVVLL